MRRAWRQYPLAPTTRAGDILSTIMHGARISLGVGLAAGASRWCSRLAGPDRGLCRGRFDALIMRIAECSSRSRRSSLPLLIDGVARIVAAGRSPRRARRSGAGAGDRFAGWVQYARTVRGSTMVEKEKEYVQAARVVGRSRSPSCVARAAERHGGRCW